MFDNHEGGGGRVGAGKILDAMRQKSSKLSIICKRKEGG